MISILKEYSENNERITEYTKDGITVSHIVNEAIFREQIETKNQLTLDDKINYLYYKLQGVIE